MVCYSAESIRLNSHIIKYDKSKKAEYFRKVLVSV